MNLLYNFRGVTVDDVLAFWDQASASAFSSVHDILKHDPILDIRGLYHAGRWTWPVGNQGGGKNNYDYTACWSALGWVYLKSGMDERAEQCFRNAWEWVKYYARTLDGQHGGIKDTGHTYLAGVSMVRDLATRVFNSGHVRAVCDRVLEGYGNRAFSAIERYYNNGDDPWFSTRYFTRALANMAIGLNYLRGKFFVEPYLTQPMTYPVRYGEAAGWTQFLDGVPFHSCELGKSEYYWSRTGGVTVIYWQEWFVQTYALLEAKAMGLDLELVDTKLDDLRLWFDRVSRWYDEPDSDGIGPTGPVLIPGRIEEQAPLYGSVPMSPGAFYIPWCFFADSDSRHPAVLNAHAHQLQTVWPGFDVVMFSPMALEAVRRWKEAR